MTRSRALAALPKRSRRGSITNRCRSSGGTRSASTTASSPAWRSRPRAPGRRHADARAPQREAELSRDGERVDGTALVRREPAGNVQLRLPQRESKRRVELILEVRLREEVDVVQVLALLRREERNDGIGVVELAERVERQLERLAPEHRAARDRRLAVLDRAV